MQAVIGLIQQSAWWHKAAQYPDRHYHTTAGIMLTDHLLAVTQLVDQIFTSNDNYFLNQLFELIEQLGLEKSTVLQELIIVALLHDIGKTEDDKSQYVIHPLNNQIVINRHSVVGVRAAIDILENCDLISTEQKSRIYWIIEQHDISYGLFREYKRMGNVPAFATWEIINKNIHNKFGAGLIYLLIFKLADIHGHANIEDVIWFYTTVNEHYFKHYGIELPIPEESDIR